MPVQTIKINGIDLDVYYEINVEKDPHGIGDNKPTYAVDINSVESLYDTSNLYSLLAEDVLIEIDNKIIEIESGEVK
jgi:hypothetical protein